MKKPLLAVLAVAALAVVAVVVIMENTPERRMDRRYDKLLRSYEDEPKQFCQRVVDDRDLLGFVLVIAFLTYNGLDRCSCGARAASGFPASFFDYHKEDCDYKAYQKQHGELFADVSAQIEAEFCDCGSNPRMSSFFVRSQQGEFFWEVGFLHPEHCNFARASRDIRKTWGPYIRRKDTEFHEAWLNR